MDLKAEEGEKMEPEKPKFSWKRLLVTVGIVILATGSVGGGVWYVMDQSAKQIKADNEKSEAALQKQIDELKKSQDKVTETSTTTANTNETCNLKNLTSFTTTQTYGIMGDDNFETAVGGYLVVRDETVFGQNVKTAYFKITDYKDAKFKDSLEKAINEGNSVNKKEGSSILFALGCSESGTTKNNNSIMSAETISAILGSSANKLLCLKLTFEKHGGFGLSCGSLAERIEIIK